MTCCSKTFGVFYDIKNNINHFLTETTRRVEAKRKEERNKLSQLSYRCIHLCAGRRRTQHRNRISSTAVRPIKMWKNTLLICVWKRERHIPQQHPNSAYITYIALCEHIIIITKSRTMQCLTVVDWTIERQDTTNCYSDLIMSTTNNQFIENKILNGKQI